MLNGEEVTTRAGHWLAMGLPPGAWLDWRYRNADGQLPKSTELVRALGGLAIAAHPFNPIPSIRWDFGYDYAAMDAIEVWNGPWTEDDQTAVEHWDALLRSGTFVPIVGNSDSHHEGQTVGLAQTVVRAANLGTTAIVAALKRGQAWVAESSEVQLAFEATSGGRSASCGDRLPVAPGDLVDVRLEAAGVPGCVAQIRGPQGPIAGGVANDRGRVTVTARVPAGATPYVRAELRRPDDVVVSPVDDAPAQQMVALTNPIFLGSAG